MVQKGSVVHGIERFKVRDTGLRGDDALFHAAQLRNSFGRLVMLRGTVIGRSMLRSNGVQSMPRTAELAVEHVSFVLRAVDQHLYTEF